ncbi:adenosine deaminase/editase [Parachaetomium inaequale]|uniref:Adenosine deaminase/editase n=1 Tax=Parachaetomium inaequale TaxID=2588326 RepID=A0AAN6PPA5_9PEZI|nr:adenosine deaminase/editase [Parachaetomium inaequale]
MANEADDIASAVLEEFRKLPAKRKPVVRDNGLREWVPLSGIVVKGPDSLKCVALATGMKCLPASKLPQANGVALHDWHAEILAIRAFNRFILDECRRLAQDSSAESEFLRRRTSEELPPASDRPWHRQPCAWREDLTLHMYCSEAPCGDASMELIMSSQADATPWAIPPSIPASPSPSPSPSQPTPTTTTTTPPNPNSNPLPSAPNPPTTTHIPTTTAAPLLGRGYFSHLGIVRRKPARADAPPTTSKSCSDKLALKQCTSLLSSLTSLFVSPRGVYLTTLVLPEPQYSAAACQRCFSSDSDSDLDPASDSESEVGVGGGRMAGVKGRAVLWEVAGYGFRGLRVEVTRGEFEFSRRGVTIMQDAAEAGDGEKVKVAASNLAVAWTKDGEVEEGLIGGVLQGRKGVDVRGASLTSRRRMWQDAVVVAGMLGDGGISEALGAERYDGVKEGGLLEGRRRVKDEVRGEALKGWLRNTGDGGFSL